jgi:hypothetical protein
MPPHFRVVKPRRALRRIFAAASACVVAGALATAACIVAPPPDLPPQYVHRPTILHDSVVPPANEILTASQLPDSGELTFLIPIQLDDPSAPFLWRMFIDYNYDPSSVPQEPDTGGQFQPTISTLDGGTVVLSVTVAFQDGKLATPYCHRIEFVVAYGFSAPHTPDSLGGDTVTWLYNGAGGSDGCPLSYDGSALGDGGWSMADAPVDQLPVVPESGSDP